MAKKTELKYLARVENEDNGIILILPENKAHKGNVQYFAPLEGHGEISFSYYVKETKTPEPIDMETVARVVSGYEKAYKCQLVPVKQLRRKSVPV